MRSLILNTRWVGVMSNICILTMMSGNPDLWGLRAKGVVSSSLLHAPDVLVWEDWGRVHLLTLLEGLRSLSQSQV